jgi:hypothetical protein
MLTSLRQRVLRNEREIVKVAVLFPAKFMANLPVSECEFIYWPLRFLTHLTENIWNSRGSDSSPQIVRDANFSARSHTQLVGEIPAECRLQIEVAKVQALLFRLSDQKAAKSLWLIKRRCMGRGCTLAARSEARTVFARSNTEIVSSNTTGGIDIHVALFRVCISSGLATG